MILNATLYDSLTKNQRKVRSSPEVLCLRVASFAARSRNASKSYVRRQGRITLPVRRIEAQRDEGKDDAERSLQGLHEPVRPETAANAIVLVHVIRDEATDAAREEVRRAPDRGNRARNSDAHAEVRVEKERTDVVHGKLDAEAHAVRDRHQPSVDVREPNLATLPVTLNRQRSQL